MRKRLLLLVFLALFCLPISHAQTPVVYGVFFYSPTCPHCHDVMENHWPSIAAQFGNQLQVVFVDVTTAAGSELMQTAIWSLDLQSSGVPQLIIGEEIMIGAIEIPERAPLVIQAGIDAGGVAYPAIPHIAEWFNDAGMAMPSLASINPLATLNADPANVLAVVVLLSMAFSLAFVAWAAWQTIVQNKNRLLSRINHEMGWWALLFGILLGFAVALSLLLGSANGLVFGLAMGMIILLIVALLIISRKSNLEELPRLLIPLLMLIGLIASAYLSYVEMTLTAPVCGAWGDCLAVQQSPYAQIAGIPMSLIGLMAYSVMLIVYLGRRFLGASAEIVLFGFSTFGLMFSVYLTFLEPFVIGATCAWCLTSSIVMLNLFWLIIPQSLGSIALPRELQKQEV